MTDSTNSVSQTPQSTFDEKLDEVLEKLAQSSYTAVYKQFHQGSLTYKGVNSAIKKAKSEAKAAITSLVLEEFGLGEFIVRLITAVINEEEVMKDSRGHKRMVIPTKKLGELLRAQQRSIITKQPN